MGRVLVVMAVVAAGMFLALKIGFVLHRDPQPAPIDSNMLTVTAALVLLAGAVAMSFWAVQAGARAASLARVRKEAKLAASVSTEARRLRVAELAADPARAKYAPLVERGEDWSEENIDYYENPDRLATCVHLQPIEAAIRREGIDARRYSKRDITVKCRLEGGGLAREFGIVPPIRYAEFYVGDRGGDEHPMAFLICDEHKVMIHSVHPDEPQAKSLPWFPSPPS